VDVNKEDNKSAIVIHMTCALLCVLYAIKCVSYAHEKRKKICPINGTGNDIRAIDTNFHEIELTISLSYKLSIDCRRERHYCN